MAGCGLEDARLRAEQLRLTIAGICANGTVGFKVSASFGIASTASSGYDLRQLLAHADSALYTAKRAGRNRVAVYDTNLAMMGISTTGSDPALNPAGETALEAQGEPQMTDVRILGITGS
jgi:hypothetical protein